MLHNFRLGQNRPNPFTPVSVTTNRGERDTLIEYQLSYDGRVRMNIYNIAGSLVRTLVNACQEAGLHRVKWNGLTNEGRAAPAGVYYYCLKSREFVATKKLILLR